MQVDEPVPEPADLALDLVRHLAVGLAALRDALEVHRRSPRDRDRSALAQVPALGSVDRGRHDRHALLQRDHRRSGLDAAGHTGALARALDEEAERLAVAYDLAHQPHRFSVGLAAPYREGPERADQLTETRHAVCLDLR